eukprot:346254-Pelagomonas_calceolata.AAC.19
MLVAVAGRFVARSTSPDYRGKQHGLGNKPGIDDACFPVACEKSPLQLAAAHRTISGRKLTCVVAKEGCRACALGECESRVNMQCMNLCRDA